MPYLGVMTPSRFFSYAALFFAVLPSSQAEAPFNAAVAPDIQVVPESEDIRGFRLNLYGRNRNVTGFDLGFVHEVTGNFKGVELGLANITHGSVRGAKLAFFNSDADRPAQLNGANVGVVNYSSMTEIHGAQVGVVNFAKSVRGAQVGLVNFADNLHGVQVGLWNQVNSRPWGVSDPLPRVFPIINFGH